MHEEKAFTVIGVSACICITTIILGFSSCERREAELRSEVSKAALEHGCTTVGGGEGYQVICMKGN